MTVENAPCPTSRGLGGGTAGQAAPERDKVWDMGGTTSLKALALHLLQRDSDRDKSGTSLRYLVPPRDSARDKNTASSERPRPMSEDFEERAAIIEHGTGVPREWAEGFARLDLTNRPTGFTDKRWRQLIDDGGRFLDRWGAEAERLGWKAEDVFGVHPVVPSARYDLMGLVPLIGGGNVVAVTENRATIRRQTGAELTYLRLAMEEAVAIWEVVA